MKQFFKMKPMLVFLMILSLFSACKKWKNRTPEEKARYIEKKIARKLDLTEIQKNKLHAITKEFIRIRKENREKEKERLKAIITMIKSDSIDKAYLMTMLNDKKALVDQNAPQIIKHFALFHQSLTQKQKDKIAKFIETKHKYY